MKYWQDGGFWVDNWLKICYNYARKGDVMGRILVICCVLVVFCGCLKNEDLTGDGPKANILLVNAGLGSDPVNFLMDGSPISPEDVPFGEAGGLPENGYIQVSPGVRTVGWKIAGTVVTDDKFMSWDPNAYYTVLHFDTVRAGIGSLTIIRERPETVDTASRVRFINCVAGFDTLSVLLINTTDTVVVASNRPYLGRTGLTGTEYSTNVIAGNWRYELLDRNDQVLDEAPINIPAQSLFSFIGIGETGGTGERAPRLLPILQKK